MQSTETPPASPAGLALKVQERSVESLKPYGRNARKHDARQIEKIAASIARFGFINPILVDGKGGIVAGHGRVAAAKQLGLEAVPTISLEHLSPTELRAYRIADNRLAELADWDEEQLAIEFQELKIVEPEFDLTVVGFDLPRIDALIQVGEGNRPDPADEMPGIPEKPVTVRGDLWELGPHRLLCGDVREGTSLDRLMGEKLAHMVFTDPPYNVKIDGNVGGSGSIRHEEFAMASGEMTSEAFTAFLSQSLGNLAKRSQDGAVHFVCMDWRHLGELLEAGRQIYSRLLNLCVWAKDNGGMGSLYRSRHELVFVFKVGTGKHINNVELGRHGRYRTNVWQYPGVNTFRNGRMDELAMHPTVKPVALVADALLDCSPRGGIVLDGFAGSGTTILAAERTGRIARAVEIEPRYVDVAIRRWEAMTGGSARHAENGKSFAELGRERRGE